MWHQTVRPICFLCQPCKFVSQLLCLSDSEKFSAGVPHIVQQLQDLELVLEFNSYRHSTSVQNTSPSIACSWSTIRSIHLSMAIGHCRTLVSCWPMTIKMASIIANKVITIIFWPSRHCQHGSLILLGWIFHLKLELQVWACKFWPVQISDPWYKVCLVQAILMFWDWAFNIKVNLGQFLYCTSERHPACGRYVWSEYHHSGQTIQSIGCKAKGTYQIQMNHWVSKARFDICYCQQDICKGVVGSHIVQVSIEQWLEKTKCDVGFIVRRGYLIHDGVHRCLLCWSIPNHLWVFTLFNHNFL